MIYVLYATKVNIGGWATFTRHLVDSLEEMGEAVTLVKFGNRDEPFTRPFGEFHRYSNITLVTLLKEAKNNPIIIAALGKHYVEQAEMLMREGAKIVVHDTAESTNRMAVENPWIIRKALAEYFPDGSFIRHPYVRVPSISGTGKRTKILATSRVDFDKNTTMILDANRLGARIDIVGFENRLYTKFKIMPHYPEWKQSPGTHPRTGRDSFVQLMDALAMVDLTDIKGDGGGTQYTFLEAWDAGAIPIIGGWWIRKKDDMEVAKNCLMATGVEQLTLLCKKLRKHPEPQIVAAGEKRLKYHTPKVIVPQVMEWLNAN